MTMADTTIRKARIQMRRNTTEYWRQNPQFVPLAGEIVVYLDYRIVQGHFQPAIKIGDGKASIVSLPFLFGNEIDEDIAQMLGEHINDSSMHITNEERNFWNNKLNYRFEDEALIFTND
jgi:hypothetical protein